jgi:CubicO group peptidase (beta-lactamase class C family)
MPQEGLNKGDFTASGVYGQYVYVNPSKGIVIAKNAADREFTQKQYGYNHSMNVNIDIFRSLADYYSAAEE